MKINLAWTGRLSMVVVLCGGLWGCAGTTHVAPYEPKKRDVDAIEDSTEAKQASHGSLMAPGQVGLYEHDRASAVGDILVIHIDEAETASRQAETRLQKSNKSSYALPGNLGLLSKLQNALGPDFDPKALLSSDSSSDFDGEGRIARKGRLAATLPVRVRKVMRNGDFYVEGSKVIMVSNEEHHLYVSGLIRAIDINNDNSVPSSRVAEAEIEYTGRGDASDVQRPGWFARMMNKVWPF